VKPSKRKRSWRVPVLILACLVVVGALTIPRWAGTRQAPGVEDVPQPDLSSSPAELVAVFDQIRNDVVQQPGSADAWGAFGMLCDAHGLADDAFVCYETAAQLAPGDFRWRYHLAYIIDKRGDDASACVEAYTEALSLRPNYAPAMVRLAVAQTRHGQLDAARESYDRALAVNPRSVAARRGLGQVLLARGDAQAAARELEQAVRLGAHDRGTYSSLAQALLRSGQEDRATEVAEKAQSATSTISVFDPERDKVTALGVDPTSVYTKAKAAFDAEDYETAIRDFATIQRMLPRDPYAPLFQAHAYLRLHRFEEAEIAFERCTAMRGDLDGAEQAGQVYAEAMWDFRTEFLGLSWSKATRDVTLRALESFAHAAEEEPDLVGKRGYLTWGTTLCRLGKLKEGLHQFHEAVRRYPDYAKGYYNIGITLEELGRPEESIPYYRKAAQLDPSSHAAERLNTMTGG
jgi:tetratricopeptide (TPR) repeat protein